MSEISGGPSSSSVHQGNEKEQGPESVDTEGLKDVLRGEKIYLADDHFPPYAVDLLIPAIKALGATVAEERPGSTIVLVNPASTLYPKESENMAYLKRSYPNMPLAQITPYHWLALCRQSRKRVDLLELPSPKPYFIHPDRSREHGPLKVWVSVNVHKEADENAYQAQEHVIAKLERGGALIVDTRKNADVLIVDRASAFFGTVAAEQKRYGRDWQRNVEREWVEHADKTHQMLWPRKEEDDGVDSMAEDEPVKSSGPGRPTGKPRIEYSREDDDFICRYLAAHHPSGSWYSRKTYQILARSVALYPIAARHSEQSWHERFKKNAAVCTKRIERYIADDIDRATLRTKAERSKAAKLAKERQKAEDEAADSVAAGVAAGGEQDGNEIPTSAVQNGAVGVEASTVPTASDEVPPPELRTVAEREGARLTQIAANASAVEIAVDTTKVVSTSDKENSPPISDEADRPAKRARLVESDSEDGDQSLLRTIPQTVPEVTAVTAEIPDVDPLVSAPNTTESAADVITTTAAPIALDQPIDGVVPAPKQPLTNGLIPPHLNSAGLASPKKTVRMDLEATSIEAGPSVQRAQSAEPAPYTQGDPVKQRQPRHSLPASAVLGGSPRPSRLREISTDPQTPTASPSVKRSRMQQELMSSASKRHRALQRAAFRQSITVDTPDTVLATTVFPPRSPRPTPPPEQAPVVARPSRRGSEPEPTVPPPMTEEQRTEAVLAGQRLVQRKKEEYRLYVTRFCTTYGLSPTQLYGVINELPKRVGGNSEVYWADVERGLKEKFGY